MTELEGRTFYGSSDTRVQGAREQLALMQLYPETSFRCGPAALYSLLNTSGSMSPAQLETLTKSRSTSRGNSLAEVEELARQVGMDFVAAFREPGAEILLPCVVHYTVGHYAAIIGRHGDDLKVEDMTFGSNKSYVITEHAIEEETDGYFLVQNTEVPEGWRRVDKEEAAKVWGKGVSPSSDPNCKVPAAPSTPLCPICPTQGGVPNVAAFTMNATLNVYDVPLRYQPSLGGPIEFRINYSYQETGQPSSFSFSNLGPNWSLNWISWVTTSAAPSSYPSATVFVRGGGVESYAAGNPYTHDLYSQAVLVPGTASFTRLLPDGSQEVYGQFDGTSRYFLSKVIDPQNNATVLEYDSNMRLLRIIDAFGLTSTLQHATDTVGATGFYALARITDPYGRSAKFSYDSTYTFLLSSTDQMGMESSFGYSGVSATSLMITRLTTPYGDIQFEAYKPSSIITGLKVTYPDGTVAQMESSVGVAMKTYYWDREAIAHYPNDPANQIYTHCVTTHWVGQPFTEIMSAVPLWVQKPLEDQLWYMYYDCAWNGYFTSLDHFWLGAQTINKPIQILRTAPGTMPPLNSSNILQKWVLSYGETPKSNSFGYPVQTQDALASPRTFDYTYASNKIDLLSVEQNATGELLGQWEYNGQHLPLTYKDGSGRLTQFSYNAQGQLLSATDALDNTTTFTYSAGAIVVGGQVNLPGTRVFTLEILNGAARYVLDFPVRSYGSLAAIASGLAAVINNNSGLRAAGITATYVNFDPIAQTPAVYINSFSTEPTSFSVTSSGDGEETLTVSANTFGYLTRVEGPLGALNTVSFTYDSCGRIRTITNSEGFTVTSFYDNLDRVTQLMYPDGTSEYFAYNRLDMVANTDRLGRVSQYCYNFMQQLVYSIDPLGRKTEYGWCKCGTLEKLTDHKGNITKWNHDLEGRITAKIYADTSTESYTFDSFGRLSTCTDALEQVKTLTYNADDTVASIAYTDTVNSTPDVIYTYDPNFTRVTEIKNFIGNPLEPISDIVFTYNSCITSPPATTSGGGQIGQIEDLVMLDSVVLYEYDELGRVVERTINGSANTTNWIYDEIGRIKQEVNPLGTFDLNYIDDEPGASKGSPLLASIDYPNGVTTTFQYLSSQYDQRLRSIANSNSSGAHFSHFAYGYDPVGQILRWVQEQPAAQRLWQLDYDKAGQLLSMSAGDGTEYRYAFDEVGNRITVQQNLVQKAIVGGILSASDTITITVNDPALPGGEETVAPYTVQGGDTHATVAASLAALVTASTNLHSAGIDAISDANAIIFRSKSTNNTQYSASISGAETLTFGTHETTESVTIGGAGNLLEGDEVGITIRNASLSGGEEAVSESYQSITAALAADINTNGDLSSHGISADSIAHTLAINSDSEDLTHIEVAATGAGAANASLSSGICLNGPLSFLIRGIATEGDTLGIIATDTGIPGNSTIASYTVQSDDTLEDIAAGIAAAITANAFLQDIGVKVAVDGTKITLTTYSTNVTFYRPLRSIGSTSSILWDLPENGTTTLAIGGSATEDDLLTITVYDAGLSGGSQDVSYTVQAGDDLNDIATALASAINAAAALQEIEVSAVAVNPAANAAVVNILSESVYTTTYSVATSSGSTATIALCASIGLTGAAYNDLNQMTTVATGGYALFAGSTDRAVESVEIDTNQALLSSTQQFAGSAEVSAGQNTIEITATTGNVGGTSTANYSLVVAGGASQTFTYDSNGNMTSDGARSFVWDAENRLLRISYPGTDNYTQFSYDGLGRCILIQETEAGSITDTRRFLWCGTQRCEERDASGAVTKRFFALGQRNGTTNLFYGTDHLGSIRDVIDAAGNIRAQYSYSPFGERIKIAGTGPDADFGFAGMYHHDRSRLNLTMFRAYDSRLARWLSRDPGGEGAGINLYSYVRNNPINQVDLLGLMPVDTVSGGVAGTMGSLIPMLPGVLNEYMKSQQIAEQVQYERDVQYARWKEEAERKWHERLQNQSVFTGPQPTGRSDWVGCKLGEIQPANPVTQMFSSESAACHRPTKEHKGCH